MHEESASLSCNIDLYNPLDHSHASSTCSESSISSGYSLDEPINNPKICDSNVDLGYENNMFSMLGGNVDDFVSLGCFSRFNTSIDPYCICLGDLPLKITWITFFNLSYDFSMVIDKFNRILILFGVILIIASYLLFSELWA